MNVKKRNGRLEEFNVEKINACAIRACRDIEFVSASEIVLDAQLSLYNKVTTTDIDLALILSAREKIEKEPNYSFAAARILLNCLYKEVFKEGVDSGVFDLQYRKSFIQGINKLIFVNRLDERMNRFDLKLLSENINTKRDLKFKYLGLQILADRYFIRESSKIIESPQGFWMRVAMGLSLNEKDPNASAIELYNSLSDFSYTTSTPTLFNSGSTHSQLSSCYLNTFDDSIDGIFDGLWQESRKSKYAGGLGFDVTPFRSSGAYIKGTNGSSSGLIPWLKLFNDTLVAVNQGGKRPGAGCAYLEPWHLDYEDFLDLRKNTGDDRLRCHDLNTASWIPDIFMEKVLSNSDWYLFNPSECTDLHDAWGEDFSNKYEAYCKMADEGLLKNHRIILAKDLWKKMLKSLFETSHPWVTFKDPCNIRYTNQHEGVVHSSNLCTEITLHNKSSKYNSGEKTEIGETAVCNLASVNLVSHLIEDEGSYRVDWEKLKNTILTAIRGLDNVIDINFYPTEEARKSNITHRPVGLGVMGWHDALHKLNIRIDSEKAESFNDEFFEFFSYYSILGSSLLAEDKGKYPSYEGSLWSQNIFPEDSYKNLMKYRGVDVKNINKSGLCDYSPCDWDYLRNHVREFGMRNSNVMAIAPTATIGYINGVEQSIEPNYSVLFVYENKSGNFFIINENFVSDMKKKGFWSKDISEAVKSVDGDLSLLGSLIPEDIKIKYKNAFNRDMFKLIDCNAARQKWIDQAVSFNLYNNRTSLKHLNDLYFYCWKRGLKTTYYLRNLGASKVEKSVSSSSSLNNKKEAPQSSSCSILDPGCESCQ